MTNSTLHKTNKKPSMSLMGSLFKPNSAPVNPTTLPASYFVHNQKPQASHSFLDSKFAKATR